MTKIIVKEGNQRIDKFLSIELGFSRMKIKKMLDNQLIIVNDDIVKPNYKTKIGDEIIINELVEEEIKVEAKNIPINIIYEDKDIIVVNKESGMVVHPSHGHWDDTLVNALMYHCDDLSEINGIIRPGIVHRIDKDTSGLLMVAKNDTSHQHLAKQLFEKTVNREYIALLHGIVPHDHGKINAPIGRDPKDRKKMTVIGNGRDAVTHFTVLERFDEFTLIKCKLETGRTHQIRVHLKYIGYPLVGDTMYGRRKVIGNNGQFLHAKVLGFTHPTTNQYLEFNSELPEWFNKYIEDIRIKSTF
ncbi:RluA family pseudouridine synthase [Mycoplasmatota bacterium]|nr:RluA family pseudouridine synthase [Mycoplasmatota bacterium]